MITRRAASAGFWSSVDVIARQSVQFVVSLVLARLLAPADFGTIALMTFFSSLAQVFVQGGLSTALIQRQDSSIEEESTIFWLNLIASALLSLALVILAPAVADFYHQPVLRPLVVLAAGQVIVSAFGAVHAALLSRSLEFARLAIAGLFASLLSGAAGVAAAALGAGLWALALQVTLASISYSAALWVVSPWRPRLRFRLASITSHLRFGAWLSVSSVLDVLFMQGFSLLVGKLHGVRDLGLYNRAAGTQQLPSGILSMIIGRVALPLFSPRSGDEQAIRRGMRMAIAAAMILNVPIMVGLALLPDLVIATLFGEKWLPAAPILSILAISGLLYPLHVINLQVLLARGASQTFFRLEVAKKLVGIACFATGSLFGIRGLAWSQVVASALAFLVNAAPARRSLRYSAADQLWDLRGILACSLVMGAGVTLVRKMLILPSPLQLAVLVPLGTLIYLGCGFGLRVGPFMEALHILRMMLRPPPAAAVAEGSDPASGETGSGGQQTDRRGVGR